MMTFLFILFAFISAVTITAGIFILFETEKIGYSLLILVGIVMAGGTICFADSNLPKNPTKQDVIDGKAYYQETQVITGNDTIKTYDIVWKQENF